MRVHGPPAVAANPTASPGQARRLLTRSRSPGAFDGMPDGRLAACPARRQPVRCKDAMRTLTREVLRQGAWVVLAVGLASALQAWAIRAVGQHAPFAPPKPAPLI